MYSDIPPKLVTLPRVGATSAQNSLENYQPGNLSSCGWVFGLQEVMVLCDENCPRLGQVLTSAQNFSKPHFSVFLSCRNPSSLGKLLRNSTYVSVQMYKFNSCEF